MNVNQLLAAWHEQQTAFIELRDLRTRIVTDVLAYRREELSRPLRILDIACGPGSLAHATLERLPDSTVVAIDKDPILLRLGRETNRYGDRLLFIDADLDTSAWLDAIPEGPYDAAISATALHWLPPHILTRFYIEVAQILTPGGIVMDADHLYHDHISQPYLHQMDEQMREKFRVHSLEEGTMTWDQWWHEACSMPGWEEEAAERERRWANDGPTLKVSAAFHREAMRAAGFSETGQLFQFFDDRIVYGRLPDDWTGQRA